MTTASAAAPITRHPTLWSARSCSLRPRPMRTGYARHTAGHAFTHVHAAVVCTAMTTLLTPRQVAEICQVSHETIHAWLRAGRLPGIHMGRGWRIDQDALQAWLKAHSTGQGAP
jgi:excisionase family DNA binding protein